jgi:subtilase family serine protease
MSKAKIDADYLYNHYKQSGAALADTLYQRIVKTESLKLWEAKALRDEFRKLVKQGSAK